MRPIVAALARRGLAVRVWTGAAAQRAFEAETHQLPGVDTVDLDSFPPPCRYVTHAAEQAPRLAEALQTDLIVYDQFAVIGRVLGHRLQLPHVAVCAGHNRPPTKVHAQMAARSWPRPSLACRRAARELAESGLPDVSPFFYLRALSPDLNLCSEPPEFLPPDERAGFEPLAFFGSQPSLPAPTRGRGVYVALGTLALAHYRKPVHAFLRTLIGVLADRGEPALVSLGGGASPDLGGRGVRVESFVDQQAALRDARVFVTHHGLNSTHEAIAHGVPMLSAPLFADQPDLALRCQRFGIALPLGHPRVQPVEAERIHAVLDEAGAREDELHAALARARAWEERVIAGRDAVIDRMLSLARDSGGERLTAHPAPL